MTDRVDEGLPVDTVSSHPTADALAEQFGTAITRHLVSAGDQHVVFVESARIGEVLAWLKETPSERYDLLRDVTAVDYGGGRPLEVVYVLWSVPHRRSLRVKCELPITELSVPSATGCTGGTGATPAR